MKRHEIERPLHLSFLATTKGEIVVWIHVLRDQAPLKLCFHLISGIARAHRPAEDFAEERAMRAAAVHAIANGHVPVPFGGEAKS